MGRLVIPVLSVIGRSNTGKTTLLERLIPVLKSRGLRVGTIKHHAGDFEIDREGKDSYRHKKAGASVSMITSSEKIGLVADVTQELTLSELVRLYMRDIDLVITEGYKREHMPKLEVYVYQKGLEPLAKQDPDVIAIAADRMIDAHVPVFLRDEPEAIAEFIITKFRLPTK
ncbi:MAG: molybdopterin-guanine dinucleotide biosynthesis protein B [Syntrophorhabdales bacterium]|jgi:molybdopterin-guanine dinucleotide biosynthesis protein B